MNISKLLNPFYIYKRRDRILPLLYRSINQWCRRTHRTLNDLGIPVNRNELHLAVLKNRHKGKRCFVIGNGPSLRISDLDKIHNNNDIAIASNKIYLAFEETDWRPTYYTVADLLVAENNAEKIRALGLVKLFRDDFKSILGESGDPGVRGNHLYYHPLDNYTVYFSPNAIKGFHVGETITNVNIQLAYYLGCNPIYVIGIDGVYQNPPMKEKHQEYGEVFVSQGEVNHFLKDYRKPGETWSIPKPDHHEMAYNCCRSFLESHGITILNASRHSVVRAFEQIELDTILK